MTEELFKPTEAQFNVMVDLQEAMNCRFTKDWRKENYAWTDAIWTEAAEAYNHLNWPWWKGQGKGPDLEQVRLEIVDIWHFLLSEFIQHEKIYEPTSSYELLTQVSKEVTPQLGDVDNTKDKHKIAIKFMIMDCFEPEEDLGYLGDKVTILLSTFMFLMRAFDMSWNDLYKLYVGKNTLNQFRQDNGYKVNTEEYKSKWYPKEDNETLTLLLNTLDINSLTFKEDLYSNLQKEYLCQKS